MSISDKVIMLGAAATVPYTMGVLVLLMRRRREAPTRGDLAQWSLSSKLMLAAPTILGCAGIAYIGARYLRFESGDSLLLDANWWCFGIIELLIAVAVLRANGWSGAFFVIFFCLLAIANGALVLAHPNPAVLGLGAAAVSAWAIVTAKHFRKQQRQQ